MKLRIRGDSLRFRLTKTEVTSLHEQGWWQEAATLGNGGSPALIYRVEAVDGGSPTVSFTPGPATLVTALLPAADIAAWAGSNEVGLYFETAWGTKVAVEKDFRCLDEERDEDESDNFDNPNAGTSLHGECRVEQGRRPS